LGTPNIERPGLKPGLLFLSVVLPGNRNRRFNNREFPQTPRHHWNSFAACARELSAWAGEKRDYFPIPLIHAWLYRQRFDCYGFVVIVN